jgi:hypothetical protein
MLLRLSLVLAFAALPAVAQNSTPYPHTSAEIAKLETKVLADAKASPTGSANQQLDTLPNSYTLVVGRVHTGEAELHKEYADQFVILHGSLTLVTGGTLTSPHEQPNQPTEIRAASIEGGQEITLHPGDIARVPANIPHWVKLAPNTTVTYLAFKQK